MKTAPAELMRTCFLGGQWKGNRVESYLQRFTGTPDYAEDFDEFEAVAEDFIEFTPYIHYDPDTARIVKVTNDRLLYAVDRDGLMYQIEGLDVMKMRMPDDETLYEWYQAYAVI
jgi:hypothetical protein